MASSSNSQPPAKSTAQSIKSNAERHSRLLDSIASLSSVTTDLAEQKKQLADLSTQRLESAKKINVLAEKTTKERQEHESLRDSTARRFAHRFFGKKEKWDEMASKEEREYVEALEQEMQERNHMQVIDQMIEENKRVSKELTTKATQLRTYRTELDNLYKSIFSGPTQEFPEDDKLEARFNKAQLAYDRAHARVNVETRASDALKEALSKLKVCREKLGEATTYSAFDMYSAQTLPDMMERNAFTKAQSYGSQASSLIYQAQRISTSVGNTGTLEIAQGSHISSMVFDGTYMDMQFQARIQELMSNVESVMPKVQEELTKSLTRLKSHESDFNKVLEELNESRTAVDDFRRGIFESLTSGKVPPPPEKPELERMEEKRKMKELEVEAMQAEKEEYDDPPPVYQ